MLAAVPAKAADVKELFAIDLPDYPGKEGRMIEVSYPPGAQDMVHRHDADAFVYVLEGQIVMQLKGQPAVTLKAGQTFYEGLPMFTSWGATPATRSRPGSSWCC
jgi:quercetin dioxygenase-like cupin family protein